MRNHLLILSIFIAIFHYGISADEQFLPTVEPTATPTKSITIPTNEPTLEPTSEQTIVPPTLRPTLIPTLEPTEAPTLNPTTIPTFQPTETPTAEPSFSPTDPPTEIPTVHPTNEPTTAVPSVSPTHAPSLNPTTIPTIEPTTAMPTILPTILPTAIPSVVPSGIPTIFPTVYPTMFPTIVPTAVPSFISTAVPTTEPTLIPTAEPSLSPTIAPTLEPTFQPTRNNLIIFKVLQTILGLDLNDYENNRELYDMTLKQTIAQSMRGIAVDNIFNLTVTLNLEIVVPKSIKIRQLTDNNSNNRLLSIIINNIYNYITSTNTITNRQLQDTTIELSYIINVRNSTLNYSKLVKELTNSINSGTFDTTLQQIANNNDAVGLTTVTTTGLRVTLITAPMTDENEEDNNSKDGLDSGELGGIIVGSVIIIITIIAIISMMFRKNKGSTAKATKSRYISNNNSNKYKVGITDNDDIELDLSPAIALTPNRP